VLAESVNLMVSLSPLVRKASRRMRLPWLSGLLLVLVGCVSDSSRSYVGGRAPGGAESVGASLLVRGGSETALDEGAVFLPLELEALGIEGWSADALRAAGYRLDVVEFEDILEPEWSQDSGSGTDELLSRRPPRRGRGGLPGSRMTPSLNPRPTPQQRMENQRRAADLAAIQAARDLYYQRLADANTAFPNSAGFQDHHLIPVYLGGSQSGVTYRLPTAYHKMITRAFRKEWGYDRTDYPRPDQLQKILLTVYSQFPIPQLIGINP
jgi:hypothetical protein